MKLAFIVNDRPTEVDAAPGETLLVVLRRLGWKSVKDGCAAGDCGTCAVQIDGRAVNACLVFAAKARGARIATAEGLSSDGLHPLQAALIDAGGVQCGFCIPGVLMTAAELLADDPDPSPHAVAEALAGNLCRCTGYAKLLEGVLDAARLLAGTPDG